MPIHANAAKKTPAQPKGGALTIAVNPSWSVRARYHRLGQAEERRRDGPSIAGGPESFEGSFATLAQATTPSSGAYSFAGVRPGANTRYRVTASDGTTSPTALVRVAISVRLNVSDTSPDRGDRVTFSGTAKPAHDGTLVQIQRRQADGSYKTLGQTTLKDDGTTRSKYTKVIRITASGTYRVKVSADTDHSSGIKKAGISVGD